MLNFGSWALPTGHIHVCHGQKCGVEVGIAARRLPFKSYFHFRFGDRHLESIVNNVEQRRHCHIQLGRGRKVGVPVAVGSRPMYLRFLHVGALGFRISR